MGTIKFTPSNEMNTREWFAVNLNKFDYNIVKSQTAYPDYILEDGNGQQIKAEIEYLSGNFIWHRHDPNNCDLVICWLHTVELPLPVLELSTGLFYEANRPVVHAEDDKREIIKYPGLNKKALAKVLLNHKDETAAFLLAFIKDFAIREANLGLIENQRIELLNTSNNLICVLRDSGLNCQDMHPYDLFKLIMTKHKHLSFGDLRFIQVACDSVDAMGEILGEV